MKKIFTYFSFFLLVALLFSACTSHLTVTKRHYRNGYYIAFDRGASSTHTNISTETNRVAPNEKNQPAETRYVQPQSDNTPAHIPPVSAVNETPSQQHETNTNSIQQESTGAIKKELKKIKQHVLRKPREIKKIAHSGEGYSLLWIVIVAILILWAISLLSDGFGLGGVIHILLVIALILFILWLLHLI